MATTKMLSPNISKGRAGEVRWIVLHSMEVDYRPGVARNVATFFGRTSSEVSAHVCVDGGELVVCVEDEDTAWAAARTGNRHGLHVELAGRAAEGRDVWLARAPMLDLAAAWVAEKVRKFGLPLIFRSAAELQASLPGITTHREVSSAFGETDHTDPGANFPMDHFMARVAAFLAGDTLAPAVVTPTGTPTGAPASWSGRVLRLTDPMMSGDDVRQLQQRLIELGFSPGEADGIFGPMTEAAVVAFQTKRFGKANAMVGAFSWNAMFAAARSGPGSRQLGSLDDDEAAAARDATETPHHAGHAGHAEPA